MPRDLADRDPAHHARRSPDLRGLGEVRLLTVGDGPGRGQRLLAFRNAAGLALEVALDRGMDIASLAWRGVNLGWHSPNGLPWPVHPHGSENGLGFLRNFDGFLATCGLDHYGLPTETDAAHFVYPHRSRVEHPLHGRVSALPARLGGYGMDHGAGAPVLWCEGVVRQSAVFGEVLTLRRRIEMGLFDNGLRLVDEVVNDGFRPTPHAMLYHFNLGYPMLDDAVEIGGDVGADFAAAFRRDPPVAAEDAVERFDAVPPGTGRFTVSLHNPCLLGGTTFAMAFDRDTLPGFGVWRAWQSGIYALGLEPSTGNAPAAVLAAGERRRYAVDISVTSRR